MASAQGELGARIAAGAITPEVAAAVLDRILATRPPDDRTLLPTVRSAFVAAVQEIGADGNLRERIALHMLVLGDQPADGVEQAYDKAIEENPAGAAAVLRRKAAVFAVAYPDRAIAAYQRLLEIDEKNSEARMGLARVLYSTGQWAEATFQLRELIALCGDYRVVRNALPMLDQAAFFALLDGLTFQALRGAAWLLSHLTPAWPRLTERVEREGPGAWDFHAGIALATWIVIIGRDNDEYHPNGMSDDDFLGVLLTSACVPPAPTEAPPSGVSAERAQVWRERWKRQAPDGLQECMAIIERSASAFTNEIAELKRGGAQLDPEVLKTRTSEILIDRLESSGRWVLKGVCGPDDESPENYRQVGALLYRVARGFWSRES